MSLYISLLLTPGVATQSYQPNPGRGSEGLRKNLEKFTWNTTYMTSWPVTKTRITWPVSSVLDETLYSQTQIRRMVVAYHQMSGSWNVTQRRKQCKRTLQLCYVCNACYFAPIVISLNRTDTKLRSHRLQCQQNWPRPVILNHTEDGTMFFHSEIQSTLRMFQTKFSGSLVNTYNINTCFYQYFKP